MTFEQVIRAAIPDADSATVEHVLWGRTPFPMGKVTVRDLYRAASRFRRSCINGRPLCDHCDRIAVDDFCCDFCNAALRRDDEHAGSK